MPSCHLPDADLGPAFQVSLGSKKDLSARDFLPKSFISAVTRKRKKCPSARPPGSSTDEDSEHEPVKASNYGGGGEKGEEEEGREKEVVKGGGTPPINKKGEEKGKEARETIGGKQSLEEVGKGVEQERGVDGKDSERDSGQCERVTSPRSAPRPHSFLYSHYQPPASLRSAYPRPPHGTSHPPHLQPHNLAKARSVVVPSWLSPTRLPNPCHTSSHLQTTTQHPQWNQPLPVRYRKTRGGRARAVSMNLDLELGEREKGVGGWRGERVEVIRVIEGAQSHSGSHLGVPQGSFAAPIMIQQGFRIDQVPLPRLGQKAPSLSPSAWADQGSLGSSTSVVLRRSALDTQDKRRAWRRHTVVV